MRGTKKHTLQPDIDKIADLYLNDYGLSDIASYFRISMTVVQSCLREMGVDIRKRRKPSDDEINAMMFRWK